MDKKLFYNLIDVLDKTIKAYTQLKVLFEEKRDLLKSANPDDLGVTDNKIMSLNNQIKQLNKSRTELALKICGEDVNMSGFVEIAEIKAPEFVEPLNERKVKICKLVPELTLLNNQNVELLKHGIIMTNKMLETVIDAFAPQGCNYNGAGKTDSHDYDVWTVNEEI